MSARVVPFCESDAIPDILGKKCFEKQLPPPKTIHLERANSLPASFETGSSYDDEPLPSVRPSSAPAILKKDDVNNNVSSKPLPPVLQRVVSDVSAGVALALERFVSVPKEADIDAPLARTFLCPVCYENHPMSVQIILKACGQDAHGVCSGCMLSYVRNRVEDGRVAEFPCLAGLANGGCGDDKQPALASEVEVEAILQARPDVLEKYERFKAQKADATLRECPKCNLLCSPKHNDNGSLIAEMSCSSCGAEFCYYHSWGHREESTCAAYEARLAREAEANAKTFGMKDCPACKFQTEKNGGCNHMTCQKCSCDWCWICGQVIENGDVGWHYDTSNPKSGCMQFSPLSGHPEQEAVRQRRRDLRQAQRARRVVERQVSWLVFPITALGRVWTCISIGTAVATLGIVQLVVIPSCFFLTCFCCDFVCCRKICCRRYLNGQKQGDVGAQILASAFIVDFVIGFIVAGLGLAVLWLLWLPAGVVLYAFLLFFRKKVQPPPDDDDDDNPRRRAARAAVRERLAESHLRQQRRALRRELMGAPFVGTLGRSWFVSRAMQTQPAIEEDDLWHVDEAAVDAFDAEDATVEEDATP